MSTPPGEFMYSLWRPRSIKHLAGIIIDEPACTEVLLTYVRSIPNRLNNKELYILIHAMEPEDYESKFFQDIEQLNVEPAYIGILYALTDLYDDLAGGRWVSRESDKYLIDLDFIVVRLLVYYGELANSYTFPKTANFADMEQDIITIIRKQDGYRLVPNIETLTMDNNQKTQTLLDVVRTHMHSGILKHFANNFDGIEYDGRNQIILDLRLVELFGESRHMIRERIETIASAHLKQVCGIISKTAISTTNPFHGYFSKHASPVQIFLVCVENKDAIERYKKTVEDDVHVDTNFNDVGGSVRFWGLRSTEDNRVVWEQIHSGDLVLFCYKKWCFSKAHIRKTIQDRSVTGIPSDYAVHRDLLLILENVVPFVMDLENSRTSLINPTMPDEYRFPIKCVDSEKTQYLYEAYGDVESGLEAISGNETVFTDTDNIVELLQGQTTVRNGQQKFREAVLDNFHHKCAVCDIDMDSLLEASHILEVRNSETSGRTDNGICLCVLHHRMFDRGYLYFDDDYRVCMSKSVPDYLKNSCTTLYISKSGCTVMPSRKYLRLHRVNSELRMQGRRED